MNILQKYLNKIRYNVSRYGIYYSIVVKGKNRVYHVVDSLCISVFHVLCGRNKLKDAVLLLSHNDFDMNAGALYNYMIEVGLNKKYKIVWFVRKKKHILLPYNVMQVQYTTVNFRKYYWNTYARYLFYDDASLKKINKNQVIIYLGHATRAMKDCRGLVTQPTYVDYVCSSSEANDELMADVYGIDIKKMIHTGFPVTDVMCENWDELARITHSKYKHVVIWMPTFRNLKNSKRVDLMSESKIGIPLFKTMSEVNQLNDILHKRNTLLLLKFHPMQDMNAIKVQSTENIKLLSADDLKKLNVDSYKLLTQTDALISDYSSISFDYLLVDKPIAYVLSDYNEYKLGFAVDNPKDYMPGDYIYTFDDMVSFITKVAEGNDDHMEERHRVRDEVAKYNDGHACERICNFLGLTIGE